MFSLQEVICFAFKYKAMKVQLAGTYPPLESSGFSFKDGKMYLDGVEWKYHSNNIARARRSLEQLSKSLNAPANHFQSLKDETGRWMVIKLHLCIQHILTRIITKRLPGFIQLKTWHFKEISELACHIMSKSKNPYGDNEIAGFLQDLNQLRNRFVHEPSYQEFKDIMKNKGDRDKARIIFKKYEIESQYNGGEAQKIKQAWLCRSAFMIAVLLSFKDKHATIAHIGDIIDEMTE